MKKYILLVFLMISLVSYSQEQRAVDQRPQIEKEDSNDFYNQAEMTKLDLLQALEMAGIGAHKFNIGTFDKEYKLQIFADEYIQGKLINTDTLVDFTNDYGFWIDGEYNQGFIDQIKIFTKTEENNSTLNIRTYALGTTKEINLGKTDHRQFYNWRAYEDTQWKLNQKVPLLIFASSWLDKQYNFHRFCGVVNLKENDEGTQELLDYSPNYVVINYKISETENQKTLE
ncbi:DUF5041 domain-containing protein [Aureitalea marina]|uniref:DUF5041 domain-containing protein n=1 Tax=Aureitalea marina TaxID=930804 RepID=A0A2S7KQZ6_9FLAO|nr:DUF5041 domain-containing protein [Aureitalea marina]PQB05049.1 hypothetical protein BST85_09195 [Aureitalea marina]